MRLPGVPDPRDVLAVAGLAPALLQDAVTAIPRMLRLLEAAEQLVARADVLIAGIEQTREAADVLVAGVERTREAADEMIERTDRTITEANELIVRSAGTIGSAEPTAQRAAALVDSLEPSIRALQPTLQTLARTTGEHEVAAAVQMIDKLPRLAEALEKDLMPMLANLQSVAPDVHQLLDVVTELNELVLRLPGMGRLRRKVHEDEDADAAGSRDVHPEVASAAVEAGERTRQRR